MDSLATVTALASYCKLKLKDKLGVLYETTIY